MSDNTAKKQVTAKLTGDYASTFEKLLVKLQEETPEKEITARQLIEKLLDEKTVFTIAEDAEGLKKHLESQTKVVLDLQKAHDAQSNLIQNLQEQLADAADKNAKLIALASTPGLNFSEDEESKLAEATEKLSAFYGETVTIEDIVRLLMVNASVYGARLSTKNKNLLTEAREKFATIKL